MNMCEAIDAYRRMDMVSQAGVRIRVFHYTADKANYGMHSSGILCMAVEDELKGQPLPNGNAERPLEP